MPSHKRHTDQKQKNLALLAVLLVVIAVLFTVTLLRFNVVS